jgi:hypothetical protein
MAVSGDAALPSPGRGVPAHLVGVARPGGPRPPAALHLRLLLPLRPLLLHP